MNERIWERKRTKGREGEEGEEEKRRRGGEIDWEEREGRIEDRS